MKTRSIIRVRDVMKTKFDVVDGKMTIEEILCTMEHADTKCVIVDKRHDHDEYGILLISDIARKVLAKGRAPERVNAYEIMTKPAITVHPDMDIKYCARLFDRFELSRAPVVESGRIIGIVSFTDLILRGLRRLAVCEKESPSLRQAS